MKKLFFVALFLSWSLIGCPDCLHITTRHPETGTYQGHPVSHKTVCHCNCSHKRDVAGRCSECGHKVKHHQQIIVTNKTIPQGKNSKQSRFKNAFAQLVNFLTQRRTLD